MRAPAESTNQKTGSSSRSAISVARTIFSTVRAAPGAGLDGRVVGDDDRGATVDRATAGDHAVGRQPGLQGVGVAAVLDEGPLVEEQGDAVADVDLALRVELGLCLVGARWPRRRRPRARRARTSATRGSAVRWESVVKRLGAGTQGIRLTCCGFARVRTAAGRGRGR